MTFRKIDRSAPKMNEFDVIFRLGNAKKKKYNLATITQNIPAPSSFSADRHRHFLPQIRQFVCLIESNEPLRPNTRHLNDTRNAHNACISTVGGGEGGRIRSKRKAHLEQNSISIDERISNEYKQ